MRLMSEKSCGIVYISTGKRFVEESLRSIKQLKSLNSNLKVALFADNLPNDDNTDHEILIEKPYFSIKDKMMCLGKSPFHFNIFADSDTYFVEDPSVLFSIFDRFEFACSHAPMRVKCDRENVPEWFPEVNGGLLCYSLSLRTQSFLQLWKRLYESDEIEFANDKGKWPGGLREQPALREALFKSELSLYILPPEYNFRTVFPQYAGSKIKMFHGRMKNIEKFVERTNRKCVPRIISSDKKSGRFFVLYKNSFRNKFIQRLFS
jgi:hypothetical protein